MNKIVEQIGQLRLEGNVIPHTWYTSPLFMRENGKPYLNAIILMADVLYWYRPTIVRDEATGLITEVRQKFASDMLQKSYATWGEFFNIGKREVENAVAFLVERGLLHKETRTVIGKNGRKLPNVLFVEPNMEVLRETLSYAPEVNKTIGKVEQPEQASFDLGDPKIEPSLTFDEFWKLYPGRIQDTGVKVKGSKVKAKDYWRRNIRPKHHEDIRKGVLNYAAKQNKKYILNAEKWLSSKMWEDWANIEQASKEEIRDAESAIQRNQGRKGLQNQQGAAIIGFLDRLREEEEESFDSLNPGDSSSEW